jgi:hypothetical protein
VSPLKGPNLVHKTLPLDAFERPEVFSAKFSLLLTRWLAGRLTRKEDCVGSRRDVDADRKLREFCGGALVATTHSGDRSTDEAGAHVTTTVTGALTVTAFQAARGTYWVAEWHCPRLTLRAHLSLWAARSTYWFASGAHTLHTLLPLCTAVGAAATVPFASL